MLLHPLRLLAAGLQGQLDLQPPLVYLYLVIRRVQHTESVVILGHATASS